MSKRKLAPIPLSNVLWDWIEYESLRTGDTYTSIVRRLILDAHDSMSSETERDFKEWKEHKQAWLS